MTVGLELDAFTSGLRELVLSGRAAAPVLPGLPEELPRSAAMQLPGRLRALGIQLVPCLLWQTPGGPLLPLALRSAPHEPESWKALAEQARRRLSSPHPEASDDLARCLKHDLAAPLHGQAGLLEALLHTKDPGGDFQRMLELAFLNAQRLAASVEGLVDLLRIQSSPLALQTCDVSALCAQVLAELEASLLTRRQLQIEPGMQTRADAQALRAALRALLSNALKFGRSKVRVGLQRVPGFDVLCVEDDGAGFSIAHAQGLFRPFVRLHLQSEVQGLGLGLATVRAVAVRHGGWAWCDVGEPGCSAFLIALPNAARLEPNAARA